MDWGVVAVHWSPDAQGGGAPESSHFLHVDFFRRFATLLEEVPVRPELELDEELGEAEELEDDELELEELDEFEDDELELLLCPPEDDDELGSGGGGPSEEEDEDEKPPDDEDAITLLLLESDVDANVRRDCLYAGRRLYLRAAEGKK